MITLSAFVYLPPLAVGTIGLGMMATNNLLDSVPWRNWFWSILHVPNLLVSTPRFSLVWLVVVLALYPVCRWFAGVRQRRSDPWLGYF